jgi:hypothetical protein
MAPLASEALYRAHVAGRLSPARPPRPRAQDPSERPSPTAHIRNCWPIHGLLAFGLVSLSLICVDKALYAMFLTDFLETDNKALNCESFHPA